MNPPSDLPTTASAVDRDPAPAIAPRPPRIPPGAPVLLLAIVLLAVTFTAFSSVPARADSDLERLQGYWEGHGPGGECSVTITGNSLHFRAREDFWFETTFTLPAGADPLQLHATITDESSPEKADVGTVVVALYKVDGETLTLGVVEDFGEPPLGPVAGSWDRVTDRYDLERRTRPTEEGP